MALVFGDKCLCAAPSRINNFHNIDRSKSDRVEFLKITAYRILVSLGHSKVSQSSWILILMTYTYSKSFHWTISWNSTFELPGAKRKWLTSACTSSVLLCWSSASSVVAVQPSLSNVIVKLQPSSGNLMIFHSPPSYSPFVGFSAPYTTSLFPTLFDILDEVFLDVQSLPFDHLFDHLVFVCPVLSAWHKGKLGHQFVW